MNIQECDILNLLFSKSYKNQRLLAENSGHSLGIVNRSLKNLKAEGYIDSQNIPTSKAKKELKANSPRNAIILAAGFGMRMVPINTETPKGLLEIHGEPLIERIIKQLHEVSITRIYIVIGFMKEQYEYLIDKYGVELIVNPTYTTRNNLHSLNLVLKYLSNSYVIPCDIWCSENLFRNNELYSWYMVSDLMDFESPFRVNRRLEFSKTTSSDNGNTMIGICYLLEKDAAVVRKNVQALCENSHYDNAFWEEALYQKEGMLVSARIVASDKVVEINTYEQLRELDSSSNQLHSDAIDIIAKALQVNPEAITDITVLKKGMTNRSFLFSCRDRRYIMRIPGEGTDQLINRSEEAAVYQKIKNRNICDNIIYINPENGYKITEYLDSARVCDPLNQSDIRKCMRKLREFHECSLSVEHEFNIFKQINFYEALWNGTPSAYRDYTETKAKVFSLMPFIEQHAEKKVLTHIDAVPDNFLFVKSADGKETIRLIDWEYAGMQDPHVDIAMFCIYSLYDKAQVDNLIQAYFYDGCSETTKLKIYCYISACGLLWSNWCEYKRNLGVEFGEYSLRQYRFAKEYYQIVQEELKKVEEI